MSVELNCMCRQNNSDKSNTAFCGLGSRLLYTESAYFVNLPDRWILSRKKMIVEYCVTPGAGAVMKNSQANSKGRKPVAL